VKSLAIQAAALFGLLGVGLGAFGAHALKSTLISNGHLETYKTGVFYHLLHAAVLLGIGILADQQPTKALKLALWACITGIIIFSGTLYILSITGIGWLGAVTPLGGLSLMLCWVFIFIHALHLKQRPA
jgi:uncharacterized membrane protein YgdD (TMEM256/DUF423 family)